MNGTLNNGSELYVPASYILKETIELLRVVSVYGIDYCHRVPFHIMFLQQLYPMHHFVERRCSCTVLAAGIMQLLRPVDGYAYEPSVVVKEAAMLVCQQRAVGLNAVVYGVAVGISLLELHGTLVE